jgi:hypothetical protein
MKDQSDYCQFFTQSTNNINILSGKIWQLSDLPFMSYSKIQICLIHKSYGQNSESLNNFLTTNQMTVKFCHKVHICKLYISYVDDR